MHKVVIPSVNPGKRIYSIHYRNTRYLRHADQPYLD